MKKDVLSSSQAINHEYCATVVRIGEVKPIEGSDFLGQTLVNGLSIVVRRDMVKEGDIMFYAANETALNLKFLSINNQFEMGRRELNNNYADVERRLKLVKQLRSEDKFEEASDIELETKQMVGFFNHRGRVKMIKLRGCPSMGYLFGIKEMEKFCPNIKDVNLEEWIDKDFDTVNGELFIKVYVPEVPENKRRSRTAKGQKKLARFDRMIPGQFAFHYDTQQLNRSMDRLSPETMVTISTKAHGCVDKDTIINTDHGNFTIKEIVDKKLPYNIKAYDVETNKIVYVPIDQYYTIPNDGEWYEIELENGQKIIITGNNPVWLPLINCYRRADELKIGDTLLID
jgi:hypothetical protein